LADKLVDATLFQQCQVMKPFNRIELAVNTLESAGVPILMDPADIIVGEKLSMMTYLSQIQQKFCSQKG